MEDLEDVHLAEDPLDLTHVGSTHLEHGGVLDSELGESSLVGNDSLGPDVVDLSLADAYPALIERCPLVCLVHPKDFFNFHDMKVAFGARHAGTASFKPHHVVASELVKTSPVGHES